MTTDKPNTGLARVLLGINAVVFLAYGAAALLFPELITKPVDIELTSPSAHADVRAIYGGLSLSVGLVMWLGLRRESWFVPGLFLAMVCSGELAAGRIYSTMVSGVPSPLVLGFLATELVSFALTLWVYRTLTQDPRERRSAFAS